MTHPAFLVTVQEHTEKQQSQEAPDRKDKVRLSGERADRQDIRDQELEREQDRYCNSDDTDHHILLIAVYPRGLKCRRRCQSVRDRSADSRDVNDPAYGRSSEERKYQRYAEYGNDGI